MIPVDCLCGVIGFSSGSNFFIVYLLRVNGKYDIIIKSRNDLINRKIRSIYKEESNCGISSPKMRFDL